MCTCITFINRDFYFGRNLDLESSSRGTADDYAPEVSVFLEQRGENTGALRDDRHGERREPSYPLYAEAVNEKGLGMAGTEFSGERLLSAIPGEYEKRRVL